MVKGDSRDRRPRRSRSGCRVGDVRDPPDAFAGRFPQDSVWATGLAADQVDTMANVLQGNSVPNDIIQSDIQKVAQAAGNAPAEDGAAEVADDLEYQQDGG